MRMTVFGTGYLGATHAACMAELGHEVLGVDVDESKIEALSEGRVPFFEPGLPELLKKNVDNGRLSFTTDYKRLLSLRLCTSSEWAHRSVKVTMLRILVM